MLSLLRNNSKTIIIGILWGIISPGIIFAIIFSRNISIISSLMYFFALPSIIADVIVSSLFPNAGSLLTREQMVNNAVELYLSEWLYDFLSFLMPILVALLLVLIIRLFIKSLRAVISR